MRLGQESPFPHWWLQEIFYAGSGSASLVTPNIWEPLEAELMGGPKLQLTQAHLALSHCPDHKEESFCQTFCPVLPRYSLLILSFQADTESLMEISLRRPILGRKGKVWWLFVFFNTN